MKKELQDIADKENLDVHFMGYCNQDTVIEFYALSDFSFFHHYRTAIHCPQLRRHLQVYPCVYLYIQGIARN